MENSQMWKAAPLGMKSARKLEQMMVQVFSWNNYFLPTKGVQFHMLIIKPKMARNFGVENGQMIKITTRSVASSALNLK